VYGGWTCDEKRRKREVRGRRRNRIAGVIGNGGARIEEQR
jgi:hypothetical protein